MAFQNTKMMSYAIFATMGHLSVLTSAVLLMNVARLAYGGLNVLGYAVLILSTSGLVPHRNPDSGTSMGYRLSHPFVFPLDFSFVLGLPGSLSLVLSGWMAQGSGWSRFMESASGICVLVALLSGLVLPAERVWKVGPVTVSSLAIPAILFWVSVVAMVNSGWLIGDYYLLVAGLFFGIANCVLATLKKA